MKKSNKNETFEYPMFMTAKQMSKVSGIGENTLRRLMDEGEIDYLQVGSHRLLCKKAVKKYYNRCKVSVRPQVQHGVDGDSPSLNVRVG